MRLEINKVEFAFIIETILFFNKKAPIAVKRSYLIPINSLIDKTMALTSNLSAATETHYDNELIKLQERVDNY